MRCNEEYPTSAQEGYGPTDRTPPEQGNLPSGQCLKYWQGARISICALFPRLALSGKRIQETHSGRCDIVDIACDQGPVMYQCRCRHQAINHRHGVRDIEAPPCLSYAGGDRDDAVFVGVNQSAEPLFEDLCLGQVSPGESRDALPDLADYQHAQKQFIVWYRSEPGRDTWVGHLLPDLGHHIGVKKVAHSSSPRPTSRAGCTGRLISRSRSGADCRNALKFSPSWRRCLYSAMLMTTATSSPCLVTTCGPSASTDLMSSLKRCLASCNCQRSRIIASVSI